MFVYGIHGLLFKIMNKNNKDKKDIRITIAIILFFIGLFSLLYLIINYEETYKYWLKKNNKPLILSQFLGLLLIIFIFNITFSYAIKYSPLSSYPSLIINLNVLITALGGYLIFKEKINYRALFGLFFIIIGISIIILYSNI